MNDPLLLVTYHGVVHPQVDHSAQATRNLVRILLKGIWYQNKNFHKNIL